MAKTSHPRRGSIAYYPRVRARSEVPHIKAWPECEEGPRIQGFAGYKAGMTHVIIVDPREHTTTAKQEIFVPVTVIEVPPMKVGAVRFYTRTHYGLKSIGEIWAPKDKLDKELSRRVQLPGEDYEPEKKWEELDYGKVDEVRFIMYTQPKLVKGVPKKKPELMEIRVGGGSIEERINFAKENLGREFKFSDFIEEGRFVDVIAVTKGHGFQGHVKRFGVKLLHHKNRKHRRMIGTLGPWSPDWVRYTVPQAGQTGYHQRTEFNKRILKYVDIIEEDGKKRLAEEITPKGGFLHYGEVVNPYVLIHGSVPGPAKRLIRFRDAIRPREDVWTKDMINIVYVSRESKQGV